MRIDEPVIAFLIFGLIFVAGFFLGWFLRDWIERGG